MLRRNQWRQKMNDLSTYYKARPLMKTGDLLEWRSKSLLGAAIRFFSKEEVNHSGLIFALDDYGFNKGQHIFTLEAEPGGIRNNLLSAQLKDFDGSVYWYPLKSRYDLKRKAGIDWALEQVGVKYDFGSLFKNILGKVGADMRKFFCSEYAFIYYVKCNIMPLLTIKDSKIIDKYTLQEQKAPRPGEFSQYGLHENGVKIL